LIARTIVPYLDIPGAGATKRVKGIGDIQQQFFFTPAKTGAIVIGVGPMFSLPTATNDLSKTGDWATGPAIVVLKMTGPFVLGGLLTQLWTFAPDDTGPHVNLMTFQPFVNYNLADGWASPIVTANWAAPSDETWTVPVGLGVSKVTMIGKQRVNLSLAYYNNVEKPSTAGQSQLRLQVSFLFPVARAPM
jgi:hypothetical protein